MTVRLALVQVVFLLLPTIHRLILATNVAKTALLAVDQIPSFAIPAFVGHSSLLTQLASSATQAVLHVMEPPLVAPLAAHLMYS